MGPDPLTLSARTKRGKRAAAEAHAVFAHCALTAEYKELLVKNRSLERELALINGYAARLAQRLVDFGKIGRQGGQTDAPPFRAAERPSTPR